MRKLVIVVLLAVGPCHQNCATFSLIRASNAVEHLNADWKYHHETNAGIPEALEISLAAAFDTRVASAGWLCMAIAGLEQEACGGAWNIASNEAAKLPGSEGE